MVALIVIVIVIALEMRLLEVYVMLGTSLEIVGPNTSNNDAP
jgi:hypothetical protein